MLGKSCRAAHRRAVTCVRDGSLMRGLAHMSATFLAAVVIVTGSEVILQGPSGIIDGLGKSIGGFLIWLVLGLGTMPIGLALRHVVGKLPLRPFSVAVGSGICVGLALIPVLNPGMAPTLSLASHPFALIIVYSLAGGLGGSVWYAVEFKVAARRKQ
jgi:hypothetical protein